MKKVSTLAGILIILAVAIVLFGGVFWLMQNAKIKYQNDNVNIQNSEIVDWKTYRNDEYGFEVKYPNDWQVDDISFTYNGIKSRTLSLLSKARYDLPNYKISGTQYLLQLSLDNNQVAINNSGFIKSHQPNQQAVGQVILDDSFLKNTLEYKTAQTIIGLVKFTNPSIINQTAGWKTYKSDTYGYEIKYPPKYEILSEIVGADVPNIDKITYQDTSGESHFRVFARNTDFIMRDCLTYSGTKYITETKEVNGNKFYVVYEKKEWVGLGGYVASGSMTSEYHIIHNDYCYIVDYVDFSSIPSRFEVLDQIFSTFKFTK